MKFLKRSIFIILIFFTLTSIYFFKNISLDGASDTYTDSANAAPLPAALTMKKEHEYGLINLIDLNTNLFISLKYATTDNFAGTQFYPKIAKAYLREETAQKLMAANEEFYSLGYRIKVLDAYRPKRYQYDLREAAKNLNPATQGYIADPDSGSHHNRGASVDITLTDLEGHELDMPTKFDHFGPEAHITYNGCTKQQKANRELLGTIMEKHGFRRIYSEWWHFDDKDYKDYELLDVDFIDLQN